jgi:hypothetical protein
MTTAVFSCDPLLSAAADGCKCHSKQLLALAAGLVQLLGRAGITQDSAKQVCTQSAAGMCYTILLSRSVWYLRGACRVLRHSCIRANQMNLPIQHIRHAGG